MSQYAPPTQQQQQQLLWLSQQQQQLQHLLAQQQQQQQATKPVTEPAPHQGHMMQAAIPQQSPSHTTSNHQALLGGGQAPQLTMPSPSLQPAATGQSGSTQPSPVLPHHSNNVAGQQLAQQPLITNGLPTDMQVLPSPRGQGPVNSSVQGYTTPAGQQHQRHPQQASIPGLPAGAVIVPPSQPGAQPLVQLPNGMRCLLPPETLAALQAGNSTMLTTASPQLQPGQVQASPSQPHVLAPTQSPMQSSLPATTPAAAAPRQVTTGLGLPNHSPSAAAALLMSGGQPAAAAVAPPQNMAGAPMAVHQPTHGMPQLQQEHMRQQAPHVNGLPEPVGSAATPQQRPLQEQHALLQGGAAAIGPRQQGQQQGLTLQQQQLQLQQALLQKLQSQQQQQQPQQQLQKLQQQQQLLQLLQAVGNTPAGVSQLLAMFAARGSSLPPNLQALLLQHARGPQAGHQTSLGTASAQKGGHNAGVMPQGSFSQAAGKAGAPSQQGTALSQPSPLTDATAGCQPAQAVDPTSRAAALEKEALQFMVQQKQEAERQMLQLMQAQMQQAQPQMQMATKLAEQEQLRQEQLQQEHQRKEQQKLQEKQRKEDAARKAKEQAEVDKQRRLIAHQQALLAQQQRIIEQQQQQLLLQQQQHVPSPEGQRQAQQAMVQHGNGQLGGEEDEDEGEDEDEEDEEEAEGFAGPARGSGAAMQPQLPAHLLVRQLSQQQQGDVVLSDADRAEKERRLAELLEKVDQQRGVFKTAAAQPTLISSTLQASNTSQVQLPLVTPGVRMLQASNQGFAAVHAGRVPVFNMDEEYDEDEDAEDDSPLPTRSRPRPPRPSVKIGGGRDPHSWTVTERDTLRRELMQFGLGRPTVLHQAMTAHVKNYQKSEAETIDGVWHFLQALEEFVLVPDDKTFLKQLLEPVADRGKITTPGQPWNRLNGTMVRRLRLLEDIRNAMALLKQPTVYGAWLAALTAMSDQHPPAPWWNVKCDVALIYGCWKHGYANYDAMKKDPEYFCLFYDAKTAASAATLAANGAALPPASAGGANAETLTKRFRRLLDMVPRAQKAAAAAAEKEAKEAERAAREKERAARLAAERAAREAAEQAAWAEKLEMHAARARAKKARSQPDVREEARRMVEDVSELSTEGAAASIPAPGTKRIKKPRRISLDGTPDVPVSPSPKKPRAASHRVVTGKNPDELSATKLNDLIKFLMAWGLPTQLDWADYAIQHPPTNVPVPKPLTGKAASGRASAAVVAATDASAPATAIMGNSDVAPDQAATAAEVTPPVTDMAEDSVKKEQGEETSMPPTVQPQAGDEDAVDGAAVVHTAAGEGQLQPSGAATGTADVAGQVKSGPGMDATTCASSERCQPEDVQAMPQDKGVTMPPAAAAGEVAAASEQLPAQGHAAAVQEAAMTAPVTDRAQAVAACIAGLQTALALPQRVADASSGLSLVKVWSGITQVEQVWDAVRKACPALATRSDLCLRQAVLDILADMQDVETAATKKRPGAAGAAAGNKSQKQHAPNCPCAVCTRIRKKNEKEAAAAKEGGTPDVAQLEGGTVGSAGKEGASGQNGGDEGQVVVKSEASAQQDDQGTATTAGQPGPEAAQPEAQQSLAPVKTEACPEAEQPQDEAEADAARAGEGDEDGEGEGVDEEEEQGGAGEGEDEGAQDAGPVLASAGTAAAAAASKLDADSKAGRSDVPTPTLRLLTPSQAARLRERLLLLLSLHAGHELLKPQWQEQPSLMNRMGELPVWWHPKHDGELVAGVLQHSMGEWNAVFEDSSASFNTSQDDYINRQLARRALARDIQAGKTPPEGSDTLTQEEVEALAGMAEDAPVVGAALPGPAALLKRCKQSSVVILRLLRKEKYLKDDLRKKRKRAGDAGEDGGGVKKERVDTAAAALHAQAMAIALEALQAGDAAAAAHAAVGAGSPEAKPQAKAGRRGPKPKARGDVDDQPSTDPALRAEALRIALEVMARPPPSSAAAAPAGSVAAGAGDVLSPASTEQTATATATETLGAEPDAATAGGGKLQTDAQSPLTKRARAAASQRKRKGVASAEEAGEAAPAAKPKKAKAGGKGAGKAGGISELALQIAREAAAAAAGGGKGATASTTAAAAEAPATAAPVTGEVGQVAEDTQTEATVGTVGASCAPGAGGAAAAAGEVSSPKPPGAAARTSTSGLRGRGRGGGRGRGRGRGGDAKPDAGATAPFKPPRRAGAGKKGSKGAVAAAAAAEASQAPARKKGTAGSKAQDDGAETKTAVGGPGVDEEEVRKVFGDGAQEEEVGDYAMMLHDLEHDTDMADQLLGELGNADLMPDDLLKDLL